jgi:hypothetical protein
VALDAFPIATAQDYYPQLETTESLSVLLRRYTTGLFDFVIKLFRLRLLTGARSSARWTSSAMSVRPST